VSCLCVFLSIFSIVFIDRKKKRKKKRKEKQLEFWPNFNPIEAPAYESNLFFL
jgi:hypothetical protein